MIQKVRVQIRKGQDLRAEEIFNDIKTRLKLKTISKVTTATVYRIDGISRKEAELLSQTLLAEPINQEYTINKPLLNGASHIIEISYKPGVMNPEIASIIKASNDLGINPHSVRSSHEYGFYGDFSREEIELVVKRLNLFNPIVEYIMQNDDPITTIPLTIMTDEELQLLSKDTLFLNLPEMKTIQQYFKKKKRNPTDCELETLAQTWSEHCAHKTFKARLVIDGKEKKPLFSRIKKEALKHDKNIVSAFVDNSGVMDFYEGFALCGKVETHNSPSAIEPYGGAMTGSGGVFRDVLGTGQGAKPIASTDIFCLASPSLPLEKLPLGSLHPDYLFRRVVAGVRDYGNRIGIPTNNGSVHFHDDFRAKPSIIVGAYGLIPKKYAQKGQARVGDLVVCVGGRTGKDGIHGATFSSGEMTERTIDVNSSAVQIGNAIEEKRMFDAILEARDLNLIRAMQDCGAGGFSSAIGEMGEKTGVTVNLEKAALKYEGMKPWEIWVSESQERMILAIQNNKLSAFLKICEKYNVEARVLGKFDGSKKLQVLYEDELVCNLDMEFLHHGLKQREMVATRPKQVQNTSRLEPQLPVSSVEWQRTLKSVLSHGNICSKEPIVRMYDHSVQGTNDLQPYSGEGHDGPNDAVVLRPFLNKSYGMVLSHGLHPAMNLLDPYWGSLWASVEALANYVAVGGDYTDASLINNYIWPFPDAESLWSLDRSVDAVVETMRVFGIPVISGKDSLSSTYRGPDGLVIKIPPVLCMSVFGKIPDTTKTVSADFKQAGSTVILLGNLDTNGMGGSVYFDTYDLLGNSIPKVDLRKLPEIFKRLNLAIRAGDVLSTHDVSEGGIITALFEMCVGGNYGATIDLAHFRNTRTDYVLFNETAGCFIIEVANEAVAKKYFTDIPYVFLGTTEKKKTITVKKENKKLFTAEIDDLKKSWQEPMRRIFG